METKKNIPFNAQIYDRLYHDGQHIEFAVEGVGQYL